MSTVTIPQEEFDEMVDRLTWLDALEAAGVDNWDGHDIALELFHEWNQE